LTWGWQSGAPDKSSEKFYEKREKKKQAVSTMQKAPVEELQQQTAANLNKGSVQNAATRGPLD